MRARSQVGWVGFVLWVGSTALAGPPSGIAPQRAEVLIGRLAAAWQRGHASYDQTRFLLPGGVRPSWEVQAMTRSPCGNGIWGALDPQVLRAAARDIGAAAGLEIETDGRLESFLGQAALDACDPTRRVGFLLQQDWDWRADGPIEIVDGMAYRGRGARRSLDPITELSIVEYRHFIAIGWRLHVTSVEEYGTFDGDDFTPTLAYLAGVCRFLDEITGEPDDSLDALLFGDWRIVRAAQEPESTVAVDAESGAAGGDERKQEADSWVIRFDPTATWFREQVAASGRVTGRTEVTSSPSLGKITLIERVGSKQPLSGNAMARIRQRGVSGEEIVVEGTDAWFLPPTFDITRSFSIEQDRSAGSRPIDCELRVRVSGQ